MTEELPQFLRDMLANPPQAGGGVHDWLYNCARQLHAHCTAVEIEALLIDRSRHCGRAVPLREIRAAITNAFETAWRPGQSQSQPTSTAPKWPAVNQQKRDEIIFDGGGLADLWELSPVRIEDNDSRAEEIIDRLFPGNPLLCCGKSSQIFDTRPREDWRGHLADLSLIVPSPMCSRTGRTKDGKESAHTLDNTGPRRFLIVEFDSGTTDEHAALLIHLAVYAPLVCAVHSGGKSLHGWFYAARTTDEKAEKFFRYAVSLGADSRLWTRSQFCRMPDGTREDSRRQTVFFLNYEPLEAAQ